MTWDQITGRWLEWRGRIREWWGRQTHNEETMLSGRKDQHIGRIQQRYGATINDIEQQVGAFERHVAGSKR